MLWVFLAGLAATCSWDYSHQATSMVSSVLEPLYKLHGVRLTEIADACPFKNLEGRNVLVPYEAAKVRKSSSAYHCGICNKVFRGEAYLEKHLVASHRLHDSARDICPADLCTFMPCPHSDSALVRARCASVVKQCYSDQEFALEAVKALCWTPFEQDYNWSWGTGYYLTVGSVVLMFLVVYYMIVWGEYEDSQAKFKTN